VPAYQLPQPDIDICFQSQWLALYYYIPSHLYLREEVYPVPVMDVEVPIGFDIDLESGYREVRIYEPSLTPKFPFLELAEVDRYTESYASGGVGVGLELTWSGDGLSDISLETGLNIGVFEAEIAAGTQVIQGMAYIEQPGWVVFKKHGYGFDLQQRTERYLAACDTEVQKAGGYELYGKRRNLNEDYVFGGVLMRRENETQLRNDWHRQNCLFTPAEPQCQYVLE
jgi:hypothetical protein